MQTYEEINVEASTKQSALFAQYQAFFAFSEEQLKEGMAKYGLTNREDLVSVAYGLIAPKANLLAITDGVHLIELERVESIKAQVKMRKVILYELNNYECFYSGDIENALPALLPLGVTREEVLEVFKHPNKKVTK